MRFISWSTFGWGGSKTTTPKVEEPATMAQQPDKTEAAVNNATDASAATPGDATGYIPEPPAIPVENLELTSLGEPTLQSLGLGSWSPAGIVQQVLEMFHVSLDLPWYGSIILYTIILRTCLIPLTIKIQRGSASMRMFAPQMTELNQKMMDARLRGNQLETAKLMHQYQEFMRVHNIGLTNMILPLAQVPFIMSTFIGLRKMCNLPVESLSTGGALWFKDLTLSDPYFILPLISTATLFYILEKGLDTGASAATMSHTMKWVMRAILIPTGFFFSYQSSGVMFYIVCSNMFSLAFNTVLSIPGVKPYLKIPVVDNEKLKSFQQSNKKGFLEGFKESLKNQKLANEVANRDKLRQQMFEKAAMGVPLKTYKVPPKKLEDKK